MLGYNELTKGDNDDMVRLARDIMKEAATLVDATTSSNDVRHCFVSLLSIFV
jgi:hypothetical protein